MEKRQELFKLFGTFTRAFVSMTELTLGNFIPITRFLMETLRHEAWGLLILLYKFTVSFAFVSIIRGLFMQEVFKVASTNDHLMVMQRQRIATQHRKKMTALFVAADHSGDGKVGFEEFFLIMENRQVQMWLLAQDLFLTDVRWLFDQIAGSDDHITADEMIDAIARLKGPAQRAEVNQLFEDSMKILTRIEGHVGPCARKL